MCIPDFHDSRIVPSI